MRVETESDRPFGPGRAPNPALPDRSAPRALIPPISANLQTTPRTGWKDTLTAFDLLRAMADDGMVRIAMEDVKGQILGMGWNAQLRDGAKSTPAIEKGLEQARAWLRMPDPINRVKFRTALSGWLEEVLVTDALTLCPRRTVKGDFIGLEQVDGATILPLVDGRGRAPLPPDFAFEQIAHGRVETRYTLDELMYRPRNVRPNSPYGRSPVEMVLMFINLSLRAQMFDLSWFTEGNIPEGLFSLPEKWTADMITTYQRGFNDETAGRDGQRAGLLRFVPEGSYHALKDRKFDIDMMEFCARAICFAFGVSPMPLVKMMNRATAETLEVSSMESGVRPVAEHLAEQLTEGIFLLTGIAEIEARPGSDETEDSTVVYQRNVAYYGRGGLSVNEFMEETGGEPIEGDEGNLHLIDTPSGPVFLEDLLAQRAKAQATTEDRIDPSLIQRAFLEVGFMTRNELRASVGLPPIGDATGSEVVTIAQVGAPTAPTTPSNDSPAGPVPEPQPGPGPTAAVQADDAAEKDLTRWRSFTLARMKDGRPLRKFESAAIPARTRKLIEYGLHRAADTASVRKVFDAARLGKAAELEPPSLVAPRATMQGIIEAWLSANRERIIGDVLAQVELPAEKLAKDDESARNLPRFNDLDLDMRDLVDSLESAITNAAAAGAKDTASVIGYSLDNVPEAALAHAHDRAAEMVGMKWVGGDLVVNPDARFAITETIRQDIRNKVAMAIEQGWSPQTLTSELTGVFDPARAETIARTETGTAYNTGAATVYEDAEVEHLEILDGDGCLPDGHDDSAPAASGAVGVVEAGNEANGQIWTVEQFRAHLLGHPRCVRSGIPA